MNFSKNNGPTEKEGKFINKLKVSLKSKLIKKIFTWNLIDNFSHNSFGFDGQTCLLRAICELAEAPIVHHGLIGKLIDLIFT